jgi:GNAT superfamily N-acetyltransferase
MNIHGYRVGPLTKDVAAKHVAAITALLNLIPKVEVTPEEILADSKDDRQLLGKWEHSLIMFDGPHPIAVALAYERRGEGNEQYPSNTIYLNDLALAQAYQGRGLGKAFFKLFLDYNIKLGFKHLSGPLNFSLQTNPSDWNAAVLGLYESFGFTARASKAYPNRVDVVMGLTPPS